MLRAVAACSALGRDAQAMIPDLLLVLNSNPHSNVRSRAAWALGEIGGAPEKVVPALVQSLSRRAEANVLLALGNYGGDAKTAVPTIVALLDGIERRSIKELNAYDRTILYGATKALHRIAPQEAQEVLPLLREVLEQEHDPFLQSRLGKLVNVISGVSGRSPEQR
jgi:HEAT repeat protein